jgi:hypothetical protein
MGAITDLTHCSMWARRVALEPRSRSAAGWGALSRLVGCVLAEAGGAEGRVMSAPWSPSAGPFAARLQRLHPGSGSGRGGDS